MAGLARLRRGCRDAPAGRPPRSSCRGGDRPAVGGGQQIQHRHVVQKRCRPAARTPQVMFCSTRPGGAGIDRPDRAAQSRSGVRWVNFGHRLETGRWCRCRASGPRNCDTSSDTYGTVLVPVVVAARPCSRGRCRPCSRAGPNVSGRVRAGVCTGAGRRVAGAPPTCRRGTHWPRSGVMSCPRSRSRCAAASPRHPATHDDDMGPPALGLRVGLFFAENHCHGDASPLMVLVIKLILVAPEVSMDDGLHGKWWPRRFRPLCRRPVRDRRWGGPAPCGPPRATRLAWRATLRRRCAHRRKTPRSPRLRAVAVSAYDSHRRYLHALARGGHPMGHGEALKPSSMRPQRSSAAKAPDEWQGTHDMAGSGPGPLQLRRGRRQTRPRPIRTKPFARLAGPCPRPCWISYARMMTQFGRRPSAGGDGQGGHWRRRPARRPDRGPLPSRRAVRCATIQSLTTWCSRHQATLRDAADGRLQRPRRSHPARGVPTPNSFAHSCAT